MGIKTKKTILAICAAAILSGAVQISCLYNRHVPLQLKLPAVKEGKSIEEEFKLKQIISALKQFVYAYYNLCIGPEALPKTIVQKKYITKITEKGIEIEKFEETGHLFPKLSPEEILKINYNIAKENLDRILLCYGLGTADMLERKIPKKLNGYFNKKKICFKRFRVGFAKNTPVNFTLERIINQEEITVTLWNSEHSFKRITLGKPEIESFLEYSSKKEGQEKYISGAAVMSHGKEVYIEFRPHVSEIIAKSFYSELGKVKPMLEDMIKNSSLFDFCFSEEINPEFFKIMGRVLRYQGIKQEFESSKCLGEFVKKFAKIYEMQTNIEESQHILDIRNYDARKRSELFNFYFNAHLELRGLLARIYHVPIKNNKEVLGQCFALLYNPFKSKEGRTTDPHDAAAYLALNLYLKELVKNQAEYPNIYFGKFNENRSAPYSYFHILKQFPSLTSEQVKAIAGKIFKEYYKGKTLEQYLKDKFGIDH